MATGGGEPIGTAPPGRHEAADGGARKGRVFISHAREDTDFAEQLVAALDLSGFEAVLDRQGRTAGDSGRDARTGGLVRDADAVVLALSPQSAASKLCGWEVAEAIRLNKRIVPVICRAVTSTAAGLQQVRHIYFYAEPKIPGSGFGAGLAQLVQALNADLEWVRGHTRLLQRAMEWDASGRTGRTAAVAGGDRRGQGLGGAAAEGCAGADLVAVRVRQCERVGAGRAGQRGVSRSGGALEGRLRLPSSRAPNGRAGAQPLSLS